MLHTRAIRLLFKQLTEERVVRVSGWSEGGVPSIGRLEAFRKDRFAFVWQSRLGRCCTPRRSPAGRRGRGRLVLHALRSEQNVEVLEG